MELMDAPAKAGDILFLLIAIFIMNIMTCTPR